MRVVRAETGPLRLAPVQTRPTAQMLIEADAGGGQLAATQVVIPPGGRMPEHDHGDSAALVVPLAGELVIASGSQQEKVTAGVVVLLDRGERVRLTNQTGEPITLIAVFAAGSESANRSREMSGGRETSDPVGDSEWAPAGRLDQLEEDTAVHLDLAGHPVCLARSGGSVHALLDECSHGQVALSDGDVENGQVECWLHGSRFDLTTGVPTGLPATRPPGRYRFTRSGSTAAASRSPCRHGRRVRHMVDTADQPSPVDLPPPAPSSVSPEVVRSFRSQLTTGEDVVDPATWAGSVPQAHGIAPRVRVGRNRWFNLLWLLPIGFVVLIVAVAAAKGLRNMPSVQRFIARYPGTIESASAERSAGLPAWVDVQHFFNLFLMIFIIRSGVQILSDHPRLYWTRHSTPGRDWFRIQKPVPADPLWTAKKDSISLPGQVGLPGIRHSIGLARWWHLGTDTAWLLNGLVFYVLLFGTGQWRRLVPTSWDVFPNAGSVLVQYLSLDWPTETGWVAYNSLQLIAYFITVFVAAPLALITGLGMSPALSTRFKRISKLLSIQTARSLHFLVLVWFLVFIVIHVTLVFTTGLLRNLNHVYAGRDANSWVGFWIFAVSMVVVVIGWVAATPFTLRHPRVVQRVGYALIGPAQRLFEHLDATPGEYTEKDISPYFWHNGQYPESAEYKALFEGNFADYRLRINGLVDNPVDLDLVQLRALPHQEQITQHFCIQGWSGIAKWGGVSMRTILDLVKPRPEAKWVVFYSLGDGPDKGIYYDAHPIEQMSYHLTMLAYDMNGAPLSFGHGAPLRLRNETQLGFKQVKWIKGVEFVAHYSEIGGGYGGYNQDHEFFGYRQSI